MCKICQNIKNSLEKKEEKRTAKKVLQLMQQPWKWHIYREKGKIVWKCKQPTVALNGKCTSICVALK